MISKQFESKSSIKERLLKGGFWVLIGFLVNGISGFALSALLARILTAEELGAYFLSFSIVMTGSSIAQLGMRRTSVKMVAASLAQDNYALTLAVIKKIVVIGFLSAAVLFVIWSIGAGKWLASSVFKSALVASTIGLTGIWMAGHAVKGLVAEIFRGFHDIRMAVVYNRLLGNVFFMLSFAVLWMVWSKTSLSNVLTVTSSAVVIITIISLSHLYLKLSTFPTDATYRSTDILRASLPLLLSGLMLMSMKEVHLWFLGAFRPEEDVALYGAVIRLVMLVSMPLLLVNNMIPPSIAELYVKNDTKKIQQVLQISAVFAGVPSLLGVTICVWFGADVLSVAYGEYYRQGYFALAVTACGDLFNVLVGSPGVLLVMSGHERIMMKITLASFLISVLTSLILIPPFGILGAACGYSAGRIASNLGTWLYVMIVLKIKTHFSAVNIVEAFKLLRTELGSRK